MQFRTWPVVAIALLGLLTLIVVSILAAQRKADTAYAHFDSLNARYKERVKDINGAAFIETKPGGGTVVHITLPVPASESSKEDVVAHSARR